MRATILKGEELRRFWNETKIYAEHVQIQQNRGYYYVVIINKDYIKLRIKKELALQFLWKNSIKGDIKKWI